MFARMIFWMAVLACVTTLFSHRVLAQNPFLDVPDDPQTVREMVDNIQKTDDIPSDAGVLYQEITNARQQYEAYRGFRNQIHVENLQTQKSTFHINVEGLRVLADDCFKKKDRSEAELVRQRLAQLNPTFYGPSDVASNLNDQLQKLFNLPSDNLCKELSDPAEIGAVEKAEDLDVEKTGKALTNRAVYASQIADAWRNRYDALRKQANRSSEATLLRVTLLVIVGGVCVFSWLIFRGVAAFESELQKELITSGQLIQFPTVMILLVVIVVLGLSSILDDKTLGALLGGIAGYVLSQGVGQSASRQALRAAMVGSGAAATPTTNLNPPGPPTPPGPPKPPLAPNVQPEPKPQDGQDAPDSAKPD